MRSHAGPVSGARFDENFDGITRQLSMIILCAIGNFGNGSDSQIIGRTENLGYCT